MIFFSIICSLLVTVYSLPSIGRERNEVITKLAPKDSLGEFSRNHHSKSYDKGYVEGPVYRSDMSLALLRKSEIGKEMMDFFEDRATTRQNIKAFFITTDEMGKFLIEKLVRRHANLEDMTAVIVEADVNVRSIIEQLIPDKDEAKDIKALMFVKDQSGKDIVDQIFAKEEDRRTIKVFSVRGDPKTRDVIRNFLGSQSSKTEIKLALLDKEDNPSTMVTNILKNERESMKVVVIGPETRIKHMIVRLMERKDVTTEYNIAIMGDDDRTNEMVKSFNEFRPEEEEVKLVLLDKFGNEKPAGSGFTPSGFKPYEVNEYLGNVGEKAKDINYGLVDYNRYQTRCHGVSNEVDMVRASMEAFFARLKSYISVSSFEYITFEAMGPQINQELENLNVAVGRVEICDKRVLIDLGFLHRMFAYMVESIELLKYYRGSSVSGRHLLFSVVELNVRLFALRNIQGEPDSRIDGYAAKVTQYLQLLNFWAAELKNYEQLPFGFKMMFRKQFGLAEAALVPLARAVVKHDDAFT